MTPPPPDPSSVAPDQQRPSSSPSLRGVLEPGLAEPRIGELVAAVTYVEGVLEFERALARASAAEGVVPDEAAEAIIAVADLSSIDLATLGARAGVSGSPVVPIVEDLCVASGPVGSGWAHFGATSQDAWDTATVIVAKKVVEAVRNSLANAAARAADLARREVRTLMIGRTLGQHAGPYSFGLKAAGWCLSLVEAHRSLGAACDGLAVQLGGATGSLSGFGEHGASVRRRIADELRLVDPVLPWHTNRISLAQLAGAFGVAAGVWSKIGLDVVLLAQSEVGELWERGSDRGRSSAMPHKRNPSRAVEVRAGALRVPGLVSTVLSAMGQENERAAGSWQGEWAPLRELMEIVGGISLLGEELLASLELDRERMKSNFALLEGLPMSEALANLLAPRVGRLKAQGIVRGLVEAVRDRRASLHEVAVADERVRSCCSDGELAALFDVTEAPEECVSLVVRALEAFESVAAGHLAQTNGAGTEGAGL